jgi:hypothetical protein
MSFLLVGELLTVNEVPRCIGETIIDEGFKCKQQLNVFFRVGPTAECDGDVLGIVRVIGNVRGEVDVDLSICVPYDSSIALDLHLSGESIAKLSASSIFYD